MTACICRLVTALLQGAQADSSDPASWQQAFTRAYDTGASLVGAAQPVLPVQLDQALSCGHLMRTCLEQGRLAAAPGAGKISKIMVSSAQILSAGRPLWIIASCGSLRHCFASSSV